MLGFDDLLADARLADNNARVRLRPELMPILRERLAQRSAQALAELFEGAGLPYAPIRKPEELYDDPHLLATGGLAEVTLTDGDRAGQRVRTTLLPFTLDGQRLGAGAQPPHMGQDTGEVLSALGYSAEDIAALKAAHAVA